MPNLPIQEIKILSVSENGFNERLDNVILEQLFIVQIEDGPELKFLCTPDDFEALIVGALFAEKLISKANEILELKIEDQEDVLARKCTYARVRVAQPPVGTQSHKHTNENECASAQHAQQIHDDIALVCGNVPPCAQKITQISPEKITEMVGRLHEMQQIFPLTGAAHGALLFDTNGETIAFAEDVGRHNAFDKVIGKCLLQSKNPSDYCVALSSRVSFEMLSKAARAGIELIAAVSAPSSLAIQAADYWNITLCCFVRGTKFNVYTHQKRLKS